MRFFAAILNWLAFFGHFVRSGQAIDLKTEYLGWKQQQQQQQVNDYGNAQKEVSVCPEISKNVFGDWRNDAGCAVDGRSSAHRSWIEDKKKYPSEQPSVDQLTEQLVRNTLLSNGEGPGARIDQTACSGDCLAAPTCCQVQTQIIYPLFGFSITTRSLVEIVQGQDSLTQPIVYRKCMSTRANLIVGHCEQTQLPRFLFVYPDNTTHRYVQDAVLMPSNCECIADLDMSLKTTMTSPVTATTSAATTKTAATLQKRLVPAENNNSTVNNVTTTVTQLTRPWNAPTTRTTKGVQTPASTTSTTRSSASTTTVTTTSTAATATPTTTATSPDATTVAPTVAVDNTTTVAAPRVAVSMVTWEMEESVKETGRDEKFLQDSSEAAKRSTTPLLPPLQRNKLRRGFATLKPHQVLLKKLGRHPNEPVIHFEPDLEQD